MGHPTWFRGDPPEGIYSAVSETVIQVSGAYQAPVSPTWRWSALLAIAIAVAAIGIYLEASRLEPGMPVGDLFSFVLTSYANLLVFASGLVYVGHIRFTSVAVGKWATGLATAGAVGLMAAFMIRWYETYQVLSEGRVPLSNLYEVVLFFSALTVIIYLMMESVYRVKLAGAFVMPIVMGAVGFELWLVAGGYAGPANLVPALKSYWLHAHVLTNIIAYGAFAVAAGAGAMYLVRYRLESRNRKYASLLSRLPDLAASENFIYRGIGIGFPLFTLATILGAVWAYEAWGGYWSWDPKETWSLIVWLTYAALLHLRYLKGWAGIRMAWWAVLGFAVTLFCFLGVNMFLSGLHSYGTLD